MKVDELRTILSKYEAAELKEMVVALYKIIPKNKKEDGIDELLQNFTIEKSKKKTKKDAVVNFSSLKNEVETFLEYADEGFYLSPNRYVRKDKRSKWRFEVKRFIKQLLLVKGEDSEKAAGLLVEIYNMLSYACAYYVFPSEDALPAVGYEQEELLSLVLGKLFQNGYTKENIKIATYLVLDSNVDRETLHRGLFLVLLDTLKTPDTKEIALEYCKTFPKDYYSYQSSKEWFRFGKMTSSFSKDDYRYKEHSNHATEMYARIKFSLQEYDEGIAYFWKNTKGKNKEIVLYCLLQHLLNKEGLDHLWINEYEKAVANGIKPREYLQEGYASRKKSDN